MEITAEYAEKCEAAMSKIGPQNALRLIASGACTIIVRCAEIYIDTSNGRRVRHAGDDRISDAGDLIGIAGAWALVPAGMVDRFGCVTPKGWAFLEEIGA
jgi:hypothetical protein